MVLDKLLKIEEVLEILNIPKTSFYRYIKNGIIPQPFKIGRSSRWKTSEIQNFINNK